MCYEEERNLATVLGEDVSLVRYFMIMQSILKPHHIYSVYQWVYPFSELMGPNVVLISRNFERMGTCHWLLSMFKIWGSSHIMFTPARDFLLETPWRIIIPNPNVNCHSL
jgi:hypothetical protein